MYRCPSILPGVVDGDDVLVLELRGGLRFRLEAADQRLVFGALFRQDFEGNGPFQLRVDGKVNRPHAAGTQLPDNLVFAQSFATIERRPRRSVGRALAAWAIRSRSHLHLGRFVTDPR